MSLRFHYRVGLGALTLVCCAPLAWMNACRADGARDNVADKVRPIPPAGIDVPEADRQELQTGVDKLQQAVDQLHKSADAKRVALLPDVQIYAKAVGDALKYNEFLDKQDIPKAQVLLKEGQERADQLSAGKSPWTTQSGLVARGYISRIDGSVQPYGLVVPKSYDPASGKQYRLDIWFHGRNESLTEVNFINDREKNIGEFAPADTIVLQPYGRYITAYKFAGEIDVLEALADVQKHYHIDENRIAIRGFSMGGAACWHFAVHYSDRWAAANPGAGFAETPEFLRIFQGETLNPTDYERKLWHLYDCPDYAVNLSQLPTVAYSGELDTQKQAADTMERALKAQDVPFKYFIGPGTKHAYEPETKKVVAREVDALVEHGRNQTPKAIRFATYTLKYNRMDWITIDALGEHWKKASVDAGLGDDGAISIKTDNVTALTIDTPALTKSTNRTKPLKLTIDGQTLDLPATSGDHATSTALRNTNGHWQVATATVESLSKQHDLQGPIDDAFMDSFIFVRPSGKSDHPDVDAWVSTEMNHAVEHWRKQFRGEARVKEDSEITDKDIADSNLVLWGVPGSNTVLKRIADRLPIQWEGGQVSAGSAKFAANSHVPVLIYPNPLNPKRYVVLNSGFTYREYDYLNNARQTPKLPDWAIIDVRTPPTSRYPGKIVAADFFDEAWKLRPIK